MNIQKIKVNNWKHLEGEKEITLSPGFNILLGPNFIGKTSLLEALQYAFTGTLPSYKAKEKEKNWIHVDQTRSDVEVHFEHQDKDYIIRRAIKTRVAKSDVTEELLQLDQGNEISIARGLDVNKKIKEFLPWDEYSVNKVAFMSDDIVNEINKGQKDLFKALKEVLSFKELQGYISEIKSNINRLSKEKDTLASKIAEFSNQSSDSDKQLTELEKELAKAEKDLAQKQKIFESKKLEKERIIEGKKKQETIEQKQKGLDNFLASTEYKTPEAFDAQIKTTQTNIERVDKEFSALKEEYDIRKGRMEMLIQVLEILQSPEEEECPVCNKIITTNEKMELLHDHQEMKEKNERRQVERQQELANLTSQKNGYTQSIQLLTKQKQFLETLQKDLAQLTQGFDPKTDFRKEYDQIKDVVQQAENDLKAQTKAYAEINAKIMKIKAELELQAEKLPEQLKAVTKEYHKNNLLKDVLEKTENDFILSMIESIKTDLESLWLTLQPKEIDFDVGNQKGLDFKFKRNEKELKIIELSGSERKMLVLFISLLLNKKFFGYPIMTIDEPFEPLDTTNNEKLQKIFLDLAENSQIICTTVKDGSIIVSNQAIKDSIHIIDLEEEWK